MAWHCCPQQRSGKRLAGAAHGSYVRSRLPLHGGQQPDGLVVQRVQPARAGGECRGACLVRAANLMVPVVAPVHSPGWPAVARCFRLPPDALRPHPLDSMACHLRISGRVQCTAVTGRQNSKMG